MLVVKNSSFVHQNFVQLSEFYSSCKILKVIKKKNNNKNKTKMQNELKLNLVAYILFPPSFCVSPALKLNVILVLYLIYLLTKI